MLSEGFKGRTKIRPPPRRRAMALRGARRGQRERLQSIFIIYLRVSSDWLLPDLCPMARANSRAIAHGYRLSSNESSRRIPDFAAGFLSGRPSAVPCPPARAHHRRPFFIPITSNLRIAGNGESYRARLATRNFAFAVRARADFRRSTKRVRRYKSLALAGSQRTG